MQQRSYVGLEPRTLRSCVITVLTTIGIYTEYVGAVILGCFHYWRGCTTPSGMLVGPLSLCGHFPGSLVCWVYIGDVLRPACLHWENTSANVTVT